MEILNLEERLDQTLAEEKSTGLLSGKMGVCVYFFVMSHHDKESSYYHRAEKLLTELLQSFSFKHGLEMKSGVTGFAMGLIFLYREQYIQMDINNLLRRVDAFIYKIVTRSMDKHIQEESNNSAYVDVLIYEIMRYDDLHSEIRKELCRRFIIKLLNYIYINRSGTFYDETIPFNIRNRLYAYIWAIVAMNRRKIEVVRTASILKEMGPFLFSRYPVLHPNRFGLFVLASYVAQSIQIESWGHYAEKLKSTIHLDRLTDEDLYDKEICLENGVAGVCVLTLLYNSFAPQKIPLDVKKVIARIENSEVWKDWESREKIWKQNYSLNGYCGVQMLLMYLKQKL